MKRFSPLTAILPVLLLSVSSARCHAADHKSRDAAYYLQPNPRAGGNISDLAFRIASTRGEGMDESVWRSGGTGSYTILTNPSPGVIRWTVSYRMEGMAAGKDTPGEYKDFGRTTCMQDKCSVSTDASGPFFNPTFWGDPKGELKVGMSWKVELTLPWELGPPGTQTVTVLSLDEKNGIAILKREGTGEGPYAGALDVSVVKRGGKEYKVAIKRGTAHWVGQAVFQHGVVLSDELVCDRSVILSSPEIGSISAQSRQFMSLSESPDPVDLQLPL